MSGKNGTRSVEFWASLNTDRTLTVPDEVARKLGNPARVRVILVASDAPDADDDAAWETLTAEQFLEGYAADDALYDDLPSR